MSKFNILFLISGSIAAYKACALISRLKQEGHQIKVAITKNAEKFIGTATLEGLSGQAVLMDTFTDGHMMAHIHAVREADFIILAPASANTIARISQGFADDLVTTMLLSAKAQQKKFIAPAMNVEMWNNGVTQANIEKLKARDFIILGPDEGNLACGEVGSGRMLEPEELHRQIFDYLLPKNKKRILITSGGTRESIDGVRFLTNTSTGYTGARIADNFAFSGHLVTLLKTTSAEPATSQAIETVTFDTYDQLRSQLMNLLDSRHYDAIIHAAAVSDFNIKQVLSDGTPVERTQKINSGKNITIELAPNKKIIEDLRSWSLNKNIVVVGFKLTTEVNETLQDEQIRKLFGSDIDLVVHNSATFLHNHRDKHEFQVYSRNQMISKQVSADNLGRFLKEHICASV